ncbi:MAG TPA: phospholipid carrier-dependent glycosyltransferase [Vicinamibacterales bacterium]|nr:phospholipid carrier-dependent glycosyltransferase [Vicinamibacterales bacterium]
MIISSPPRALPVATGAVAACIGASTAWHYHTLGLTLSHYDARGHLVVARRIFDSITPGWQQIGAVWLPLPHLLNALPVQIDLLYRSGASAVAISIAAFAVAAAAIAWTVLAVTTSRAAALAAATVFALNPNVLYLQSTPMTEPLLLATTTVAVAMLIAWSRAERSGGTGSTGLSARAVGFAFALACLTRYEAWPVTATALAAAAWLRWRRGDSLPESVRETARIACYPAIAIVGFAVFSRVVIGTWFVANGFFVPENKALGDAALAAKEIGWGVRMLSGPMLTWIGGIGIAIAAGAALVPDRAAEAVSFRSVRLRSPHAVALRPDAAIAASLLATAAIPWAAFYRGHPYRIRYVVPLMAAEAIGAGILAGILPRRPAIAAAMVVAAIAGYELRPLDRSAPMVVEAQWDRPNTPERARVTACIGRLEPGAKIMASMGSLGHYMQEASRQGFAIRDFLHEGNGDIWLAALETPQLFADWLLIEEKAEGGDALARIARERPSFLTGYARDCEGAGLVLYRRVDGAEIVDPAEGPEPPVSDARPR